MQATRSLDSLSSYRENYAYSLGIQAYIYGYPLVTLERTGSCNFQLKCPWVGIHCFQCFFYELITPEFKDVVSPNVDIVIALLA